METLPTMPAADNSNLETATAQLAISPPMINFPLPRELRDMIYGLLLNADKVQDAPYHTRHRAELARNKRVAHTYRFHTNVLQLNKTISAEAHEELFRSQRFIVVSYQWPGFSDELHAYDVPIASEDQKAIANFPHHSVRLHIRHRHISAEKTGCKVPSFLILLRDIDILCRAVRWLCLRAPALGYLIIKQPGSAFDDFQLFSHTTLKKTYCTMITFRSVPYVPLSDTLEATLSRALQHLRIPGQKVMVNGHTLPKTAQLLQSTMGGSILFATALAWDTLDMARALMSTAQHLVHTGDFDRATQRYCAVAEHSRKGLMFCSPDFVFSSDAVIPTVLACRTSIEAAAALGFRRMKALDVAGTKEAESFAHNASAFMNEFEERQTILGYEGRPRAFWYMVSPAYHMKLLTELAEGEDLETIVERFKMLQEARPESKHVAHDHRLVQDLLLGNVEKPQGGSILSLTSACVLPVQEFGFDVGGHDRPRMSGWIVEDQMKGLKRMHSKEMKGLLGPAAIAKAYVGLDPWGTE